MDKKTSRNKNGKEAKNHSKELRKQTKRSTSK